jgi:type I restriction enzyme S subunit
MTLPKQWTHAKLSDFTVDRVEQGEPGPSAVPYIDIGSIDRDLKRVGPTEKVTGAKAPTRARQWVKSGDVLVSLTRPNLNAVAMVSAELDGAVASTGFDVLRPEGVLPEWVFNRVRSQVFVSDVCKGVQGVVYPAIRPADVRRHDLPIPPVQEQRRIVDAIDSFLTRLDDAVASLERAQAKLKAYRASVVKAAVEGRLVPTEAVLARVEKRDYEPAEVLIARLLKERRLRWEEAELAKLKGKGKAVKDDKWKASYEEPMAPDTSTLPELPEGWCWATADQVGEILLGRQRSQAYLTGRWFRPYLRVANIKDDRIDFDDVDQMDFDPVHYEKYRLMPGDILVSEGQSPHLVGQSAIYRGGVSELCFQKTLHRFRPLPGAPSSEFAQIVFRANVMLGVFKQVAPITTNIAHLTLEKFKASRFPLPPASEQQRIGEETERLLSVADATEHQVRIESLRLRGLRQAILKWAFEGKLVDQDPNDEPANKLLACIRAERAAVTSTKKSRRRAPKKAA